MLFVKSYFSRHVIILQTTEKNKTVTARIWDPDESISYIILYSVTETNISSTTGIAHTCEKCFSQGQLDKKNMSQARKIQRKITIIIYSQQKTTFTPRKPFKQYKWAVATRTAVYTYISAYKYIIRFIRVFVYTVK